MIGLKPFNFFENLKSDDVDENIGSVVSQYFLTLGRNFSRSVIAFTNLKGRFGGESSE